MKENVNCFVLVVSNTQSVRLDILRAASARHPRNNTYAQTFHSTRLLSAVPQKLVGLNLSNDIHAIREKVEKNEKVQLES